MNASTALRVATTCFVTVLAFMTVAVAGKLISTLREIDATAHATRDALDKATRIVDERTRATLRLADDHLRATRQEVRETRAFLDRSVEMADRRLASLQDDLRTTKDDVLRIAQAELGRVNDSIAEVARIRADLQPAIHSANATLFRVRQMADDNLNCVGNGNCWPAGITAWLGGQKVLFGEAALTMRTVRSEVPNFLEKFNEGIDTGNRVGKNVELLTRDLTGRGHPISRILWWGAKIKQAAPIP